MGNTLGTLKVSGLYHKKVKFPLKISDRAWWLEVQVLKSHGNESCRRNDKGSQDMGIDCIKNVTTDLSAKACQTKDVLTERKKRISSITMNQGTTYAPKCKKFQPENPLLRKPKEFSTRVSKFEVLVMTQRSRIQ